MTQTSDLIKKMADFFTGEEFYEKGEDARLELSPDDVRCMYRLIQQRNKDKADTASVLDKIYADIQRLRGCSCSCSDGIIDDIEDIIDKYKAESEG